MAKLRAGAASTVITPPVGSYMSAWGLRKGKSVGVHDDLRARALVVDDGSEHIAMIALDVIFTYESLTAEIRKRVRDLTGIKESNVMISASHTHTSPVMGGNIMVWSDEGESQYMRVFPEYVAGTVHAADQLLQPALVSSSSSELTGITVNRRHPEQPADTNLSVLKVSSPSGKAIAHLINFGCHPVIVGGQYLVWSADFPGPACSFVERVAKGSVCLFVNGASGDIHPWDMWLGNPNPRHGPTHEEAERFGNILGAEAIRLAETPAKPPKDVKVRSKLTSLRLTKRKMPTVDEARAVLESITKRYKPWTKDTWEPGDNVSNIFKRHPDQYMLSAAQRTVELAKERDKDITSEMQAFGLGDTALVAVPGEPFSKVGIEMRAKSKARETFIMGYSNDEINYIPSIEAITECEDLSLEDGYGLKYTYGTTLPVTTVSKQSVTKIVSTFVDMANDIVSREQRV